MKRSAQRSSATDTNGTHQHGPECAHQHGPDCNHEHGHAGLVAQIRLFTKSDYKPLTEIWKLGSIELDDTDTPANIARNIRARKNGYRVFVIETQEVDEEGSAVGKPRIAGGATVTFDGRRAYVYHFAIHPDFRGLGLGRALLETCEQQAERWGASHLRLTARSDGSRAIAQKLYESNGWRPVKELWVYAKDLKRRVKVSN